MSSTYAKPLVRTHRVHARVSERVRERAIVGCVLVGAIGVLVATGLATHVFGIPRIDDWSYARESVSLASTGQLHLIGWNGMTIVGHLVWGGAFVALLGKSVAATDWAGATAALLSLVAAYALFRRFLPLGLALFGAVTIAAFPTFAGVATTFMTDLTGLAAQLACLAIGVAAMRADGRRQATLLAASLALGFVAFTVREVSLAAPLAVLAAYCIAVRGDRRRLLKTLAVAAVFLAGCVAFYVWRQGLAHPDSEFENGRNVRSALSSIVGFYFTIGLAVLPAVAIAARGIFREMRASRVSRWAAAGVMALGLGKAAHAGLGKLLYPGGLPRAMSNGMDLGTPPPVLPTLLWYLLGAAALVSGALLAGLLVSRLGRLARAVRGRGFGALAPQGWLMLAFFGLAVGFLAVRPATGGPLYDRYALPVLVVPLLVTLQGAARVRGPARRLVGGLALAACAVVAFAYTVEQDSLKQKMWHEGERLAAAGWQADQIDAGLEWVGYHYPGVVNPPAGTIRYRAPIGDFMPTFPRAGNCVAVAVSPQHEPWLRQIRTVHYSTLLGLASQTLWVYRNPHACTGAGAQAPHSPSR